MSEPRSISSSDLRRLLVAANEWKSFSGLRTRAVVALALGSALRLKEICALDLEQVIERTGKRWRIRGTAYLRAQQSKGQRTGARRWDSAGVFVITKAARIALRRYLLCVQARGWIDPGSAGGPLFLTLKQRGGAGHERLGRRACQSAWVKLQQRAQLPEHYSFHCLRHTSITRFADTCHGNVFRVSHFARITTGTAQRYVHHSTDTIAELAELAAVASSPARARRAAAGA